MKQHLCITQRRVLRTVLSAAALAILAFSGGALAASVTQIPGMGPVPKAQCGRSDWTESGLQGQTTSWERASGDSERGYNCNLELVGQFQGEGAFSQDGPAYLRSLRLHGNGKQPSAAAPRRRGDRCLGSRESTADRVPRRHSGGAQPARKHSR